jgi:hypothetical protein
MLDPEEILKHIETPENFQISFSNLHTIVGVDRFNTWDSKAHNCPQEMCKQSQVFWYSTSALNGAFAGPHRIAACSMNVAKCVDMAHINHGRIF